MLEPNAKWTDPIGLILRGILACIDAGFHDVKPWKAILSQSFAMTCESMIPYLPDPVTHCSPGYKRSAGLGHSLRVAVEYVGVDHRRSHVAVAEQLLNRADGLAPLQQMGGTTWPQASVVEPLGIPEGVAAGRFGDSGGQLGPADRFLD